MGFIPSSMGFRSNVWAHSHFTICVLDWDSTPPPTMARRQRRVSVKDKADQIDRGGGIVAFDGYRFLPARICAVRPILDGVAVSLGALAGRFDHAATQAAHHDQIAVANCNPGGWDINAAQIISIARYPVQGRALHNKIVLTLSRPARVRWQVALRQVVVGDLHGLNLRPHTSRHVTNHPDFQARLGFIAQRLSYRSDCNGRIGGSVNVPLYCYRRVQSGQLFLIFSRRQRFDSEAESGCNPCDSVKRPAATADNCVAHIGIP